MGWSITFDNLAYTCKQNSHHEVQVSNVSV